MSVDWSGSLPVAGEQRLAVRIEPQAEHALRAGHPWLFEGSIAKISREGAAGDTAVIFDRKNRFLAAGLYDPDSPIRVRVLVHNQPQTIGPALYQSRINRAFERRRSLLVNDTNGFRLVHGANDGLPGIVIDQYALTLVLKLYSAAWVPHLTALLETLRGLNGADRIVLRLSRQLQDSANTLFGLRDGQTLYGNPPTDAVIFRENGLRFEADVVHGQKTGFFLDQRDNRQRVGDHASGCRVINAFSYSGGFGLYAARGGASEVIDIDQSSQALNASHRHFELNRSLPGVVRAVHETVQGDVFDVLPGLAAAGRRCDLLVLDPPAFARSSADVPGALRAYERLVRHGLGVLEPGGVLVASSCSSRITADSFYAVVHLAASKEGRILQEIARTGHALDHPISFPEGAYLKTLYARIS